jgi:hypothetical protein
VDLEVPDIRDGGLGSVKPHAAPRDGNAAARTVVGVHRDPDVPRVPLQSVEREEVRGAIDAQRHVALHRAVGGKGDERVVVRVRRLANGESGGCHNGAHSSSGTRQTTTRG